MMLGSFFEEDNPFMKVMALAADLIVLNLCTAVCCIPVVTAGAAFTALNEFSWKRIRGEESYLVRSFFRSLKGNLKRAVPLGLLFLILFFMLGTEFWGVYHYLGAVPVFFGILIAETLVVFAIAVYSFALLSRYDNSVLGTLKNAVLLAAGYFPRTLLMLAVFVAWGFVNIRFVKFMLPLFLFFGVSLPVYLCAYVYEPVFRKMDGE